MLNRVWLIGLFFHFSGAQKYFNCNSSQLSYFKNERRLFGLDDTIEPFEKSHYNSNISYFPTSCIDDNNQITHYPNTIGFIKNHMSNLESPIYMNRYISGWAIGTVTDYIWRWMGYVKVSYNNELFWYFANNSTDDVAVFFHGINMMNGLENLYLLNKLGKNNSVYVSIYQPSFITDYFEYTNTYSQHINNIASFIKKELKGRNISIIGNSYGSIRVTTLCKRNDCTNMSRIILTDPVTLNFPFSKAFSCLFHGGLIRSNLTRGYRMIPTVSVLREEKQYRHMENNFDWHEWTIDTLFMNHYKHNLIIVIGRRDSLISINESSYAMTKLCRVIYTNTLHGFVLFSDFLDDIPTLKSGICSIRRCA